MELYAKAVIWKRRAEMLKRGERMLLAHWRNRLDDDALELWFARNIKRYAMFNTSPRIPTAQYALRLRSMETRFWNDASKALFEKAI